MYSIIIPIYNEITTLKILIKELEVFSKKNEIIFIDDGSTDGSFEILQSISFINLYKLKKNFGKGVAIRLGLSKAKFEKIVIFDSDLELRTDCIHQLMKLDKKNKINSVMGTRFKSFSPLRSGVDWGNFMFTTLFNICYSTSHKDVLCCAKSFYRKDIQLDKLRSKFFDIDIELSIHLTQNFRWKRIPQVFINYNRRTIEEGKKLKTSDGWTILKRFFLTL
jgi:glycosyltransferase involved in cell wall biosynthesis